MRRRIAWASWLMLAAVIVPLNSGCEDVFRWTSNRLDDWSDRFDDVADAWDDDDDWWDDVLDDVEDWFD